MLSRFSCVRLFETPWTVANQVPLFMGFSRQEYWSGLPCPPPVDLPDPGIKPTFLMSPALAGRFFTTTATCEAHINTDSLIKVKNHGQMFSFSPVQSLSCVQLFATPWTAAHQASLSITNSRSLLKLMSIKSVTPSNHLILLSPSPPALNFSQHHGLFQ